ncbi:MAG: RNB domain-containing ribonuclease, partial [Aeromicrobium sp.]
RFGTEVSLALCAGTPVPDWVKDSLPLIPEIMSESDGFAAKVDRACLDQVEAWMLEGKVGQTFDGFVLRVNQGGSSGEVVLTDPPVIADCDGANLVEGKRVSVRLTAVDAGARSVKFELVDVAEAHV